MSVYQLSWLKCLFLLFLLSGCIKETIDCEQCPNGQVCVDGVCRVVCTGEQFLCGVVCVDPLKENAHCGGCDRACKETETCVVGRCEASCPLEASTRCGRRCVNVESDAFHCGTCGKVCPSGRICEAGRCQCAPGLTECDGKCVRTGNHSQHCGACGKVCRDNEICIEGLCRQGKCPAVTPDLCYGGCVDKQTNRFHCGTCGSVCPVRQVCAASTCQCNKGMTDCDGLCVDTKHTRAHCGGCGNACKEGQVCADGQCVASCPAATSTLCYGGCVDIKSDALHCGGCGQRCESGLLCKEGICCRGERTICSGLCVDLQNDLEHCGACGNACGVGATCLRGACCTTDCAYAHVYGSRLFTYGRAMGRDALGHIYIGGNFYGPDAVFGSFRVDSSSAYALYIAKVDVKGTILWVRVFKGSSGNANRVYDIATDQDNNVYLTGRFSGTLQVAQVTLRSVNQNHDVYVAKLDPTGKVLWAKRFGGTGTEYAYRLVVDSDGSLLFGGVTTSRVWGSATLSLLGGGDFFVARYTASRTLDWIVTGGAASTFEAVRGLALDTSGNVYFTTELGGSPVRFNNQSFAFSKIGTLIGKLNRSGKSVWVKTIDMSRGTDLEWRDLSSGAIVCVTGAIRGDTKADELVLRSSGGEDGYVGCMTTGGAFLWVDVLRSVGGGVEAVANGVAIDVKGRVHAVGNFKAKKLIVGARELTNLGGEDQFLVRYDRKGTSLFSESIGGTSDELCRHVEPTSSGGSFALGHTSSKDYSYFGKNYTNPGTWATTLVYTAP